MSYIGYPQPPRALTSADIDEGAVTLADISFTDTPSNLNLNGNYNDQTMRLAHNTTVTGDVTLNNSKDFTVSSSSGLLVSSASHNLSNDDQIYVQTSATLPTGLSANTNYYVISKTDDTFKLSTTRGGSAIAYTNAGSGTHTWYKNVNLILAKIADDGNPVTLTNDGSTRTLSGIGSIETSTLSSRPNSLVTGMTGELGSGVTGGSGLSLTGMTGTIGDSATFPAGHIIYTKTNQVNGVTGQTGQAGDHQTVCTISLTASELSGGSKVILWMDYNIVIEDGTSCDVKLIRTAPSSLTLQHKIGNTCRVDGQNVAGHMVQGVLTGVDTSLTDATHTYYIYATYGGSGNMYFNGSSNSITYNAIAQVIS